MEAARYSHGRTRPIAGKPGRARGFIVLAVAVAAVSALGVFGLMRERDHSRPVKNVRQRIENPNAPNALSSTTPPAAHRVGNAAVQPPDKVVRQPNPPAQSTGAPSDREANGGPVAETHPLRRVTPRLDPPHMPIAKTHAEVLALGRQRSRSYTEFTANRSKGFQSVGPVGIQLRNADSKRGYYDVTLLIAGHQLKKKHVNLYEPIWITMSEYSPPLELVVNGIGKNQISGYLSAPRSRSASGAQTAGSNARTGGR